MHLLVNFCLCLHDVRYCFCFVCLSKQLTYSFHYCQDNYLLTHIQGLRTIKNSWLFVVSNDFCWKHLPLRSMIINLYHNICDNIPNTCQWNNMKAAAVCHKSCGKIHVKATICPGHMCFKNEVTRTCHISTKCAHSQILFIKFVVRSKHAFTSFFLMFTRYAQQTENAFAAAYSTEMTVWCRWILWSCLSTWSEKLFHAV